MLIYPFAEAKAVLEGCADIAASAPDGLTAQVGCVTGPNGAPVVFAVPTWCGAPEEGEARTAPFLKLGTVLAGAVQPTSYRASLTAFDAFIVNWQRVFMETCGIPTLDRPSIDDLIQAMESAGLRHLHARIQRRCLARTGWGNSLQPSPRPCAD
jgi:hypothetical protein